MLKTPWPAVPQVGDRPHLQSERPSEPFNTKADCSAHGLAGQDCRHRSIGSADFFKTFLSVLNLNLKPSLAQLPGMPFHLIAALGKDHYRKPMLGMYDYYVSAVAAGRPIGGWFPQILLSSPLRSSSVGFPFRSLAVLLRRRRGRSPLRSRGQRPKVG